MMKLYHGSDVDVREIDLSRSLMYKDFGPGFYVSADFKQAEAFARYKADRPRSETHRPFVSVFAFDETALSNPEFKIKRFKFYSEEWIDFIEAYRSSKETDYDIVIGPIANDDVRTSFAQYQLGEMTKSQLLEALKYKRVTFQYCFKTQRAIDMLKRIEE